MNQSDVLAQLQNDSCQQKSEYEEIIAQNLDEYLENHGDILMNLKINSLCNIFSHSKRKLNNHDLAYNNIKKHYLDTNDFNILILISFLDGSKLNEENLTDSFTMSQNNNAFLPKLNSSIIKTKNDAYKMMEKIDEVEGENQIIQEQNEEIKKLRKENQKSKENSIEMMKLIFSNDKFFTSQFSNIKDLLILAFKNGDVSKIKELTLDKLTLDNGINLLLDKITLTAEIIESPNAEGIIQIPNSILYNNQNYEIISINKKSFYSNKQLKSVQFQPNSKIKIIGEKSFYDSSLESIIIPNSVLKIKKNAFGNCNSIKSVIFESYSKLTSMGKRAFQSISLQSISIPPTVTKIKSKCFYKCNNLQFINLLSNSKLKFIGKKSFYNTKINRLFIPKSVEIIEEGCFNGMPDDLKIELPESNTNFLYFNDQMILAKSNPNNGEFDMILFSSRNCVHVEIPSSVKYICSYAFSQCKKLRMISFKHDSKLRSIGQKAFDESLIEEIHIPSSVYKIARNAFLCCLYLQKIRILGEHDEIGENMFDKISISLKYKSPIELSISKTNRYFKYIDEKFILGKSSLKNKEFDIFLYANSNLQNIEIPLSIKTIAPFAVKYCDNLHDVTISPNSNLQLIDNDAFNHSYIHNIYIPSQVVKIGKRSFQSCPNLNIEFSHYSKLEIIEKYAFNNSCFTSINIPSTVIEIKKFAFQNCKIQNINFQNDSKLAHIGKFAFSYTKMNEILIPPKVTKTKICNFSEAKKIMFTENSELQTIEKSDLYMNELEYIMFPSMLYKIDRDWLKCFSNLKKIEISKENKNFKYYNDKLIIGKSNPNIDDFDSIIFANRDLIKIEIPSFIKFICPYSFSYCKHLKTVTFQPDSKLQIIDHDAFANSTIKNIKIPSSVEKINNCAFSGCKNLWSVDFSPDSKLKLLGSYVYNQCRIFRIIIPPLLEKIAVDCFIGIGYSYFSAYLDISNIEISKENKNFKYYNDNFIIGKSNPNIDDFDMIIFAKRNLTEIEIPSFIRIIWPYVFYKQENLKTVTFQPDSKLQIIGEYAFASSGINSIEFPPSVEQIHNEAFSYCSSLNSINFAPNSNLTSIGSWAFAYSNIESIKIPPHLKQIDNGLLEKCKNLKTLEIPSNSEINSISEYIFNNSYFVNYIITPEINRKLLNRYLTQNKMNFFEVDSNAKLSKYFYNQFQTIKLKDSCNDINRDWLKYFSNLKKIEISKENKNFKYYNDKLIIGKSNPNIDDFDSIIFANRDLIKIEIPSFIKFICPYSFSYCKHLKTVTFQPDSKLQIIDHDAFANSTIEDIIIPSNVFRIESQAFFECSKLKNVQFEQNSKLMIICHHAFSKTSIQKITIPSTVAEIELYAFSDCLSLSSFEILENSKLKSIGYYIFTNTKLTKLYIPSRIESFEYFTFYQLPQNFRLTISNENTSFKNFGDSLIIGKSNPNINDFDVILYASRDLNEIKIPSFIKHINKYAFHNCKNLKTVVFQPDSKLQTIDDFAFAESAIEKITIPKHVISINVGSFSKCQHLVSIEFSKDSELLSIGSSAFEESSLEKITIPKHVSIIGDKSFLKCIKLISVEFEQNSELEIICEKAFEGSSIVNFVVPSHVKEIQSCFCCCSKLNSLVFEENSNLLKIDKTGLDERLQASIPQKDPIEIL